MSSQWKSPRRSSSVYASSASPREDETAMKTRTGRTLSKSENSSSPSSCSAVGDPQALERRRSQTRLRASSQSPVPKRRRSTLKSDDVTKASNKEAVAEKPSGGHLVLEKGTEVRKGTPGVGKEVPLTKTGNASTGKEVPAASTGNASTGKEVPAASTGKGGPTDERDEDNSLKTRSAASAGIDRTDVAADPTKDKHDILMFYRHKRASITGVQSKEPNTEVNNATVEKEKTPLSETGNTAIEKEVPSTRKTENAALGKESLVADKKRIPPKGRQGMRSAAEETEGTPEEDSEENAATGEDGGATETTLPGGSGTAYQKGDKGVEQTNQVPEKPPVGAAAKDSGDPVADPVHEAGPAASQETQLSDDREDLDQRQTPSTTASLSPAQSTPSPGRRTPKIASKQPVLIGGKPREFIIRTRAGARGSSSSPRQPAITVSAVKIWRDVIKPPARRSINKIEKSVAERIAEEGSVTYHSKRTQDSQEVVPSHITLADENQGGPPKKYRTVVKGADGEPEEKDFFCWICHKDGPLHCCELCTRGFHVRCVAMAAELPADWVCPECEQTMRAECMDTRSKAMTLLTMDQLCLALRYVIQRMSYPGSEPFQSPVDTDVNPNYPDYIVNPMDLSVLEENRKQKIYGSTEAFQADAKWILHNAIVFNGVQSKLSATAKTMLKVCRYETSEIEVCPDCFMNSFLRRNENWFCEPCRTPHTLVWAKMKGYPYWPGKVLRVDKHNQVDVRFFGEHDRAWVPVDQTYMLSKHPPLSMKKKRMGFKESCEELQEHIQRIQEVFGTFRYAPNGTPYKPEFDPVCGGRPQRIRKKTVDSPLPMNYQIRESAAKVTSGGEATVSFEKTQEAEMPEKVVCGSEALAAETSSAKDDSEGKSSSFQEKGRKMVQRPKMDALRDCSVKLSPLKQSRNAEKAQSAVAQIASKLLNKYNSMATRQVSSPAKLRKNLRSQNVQKLASDPVPMELEVADAEVGEKSAEVGEKSAEVGEASQKTELTMETGDVLVQIEMEVDDTDVVKTDDDEPVPGNVCPSVHVEVKSEDEAEVQSASSDAGKKAVPSNGSPPSNVCEPQVDKMEGVELGVSEGAQGIYDIMTKASEGLKSDDKSPDQPSAAANVLTVVQESSSMDVTDSKLEEKNEFNIQIVNVRGNVSDESIVPLKEAPKLLDATVAEVVPDPPKLEESSKVLLLGSQKKEIDVKKCKLDSKSMLECNAMDSAQLQNSSLTGASQQLDPASASQIPLRAGESEPSRKGVFTASDEESLADLGNIKLSLPPLSTKVNVPKPKLPDPKMMAKIEKVLKNREEDVSSAMESDSAENPPLSTKVNVPIAKLPDPKMMAKVENVLKTREEDVSSAMESDYAENPSLSTKVNVPKPKLPDPKMVTKKENVLKTREEDVLSAMKSDSAQNPPLSTKVNVPKPKLPDPKMMGKVENVLKTREEDVPSAMESDSAQNPPLSTKVNVPKPKLPDPKMMAKVENVLKTREKDLSSAMKSDSAQNPPLSTKVNVPKPKLPDPKMMAKVENVLKTREEDVPSAMESDSAQNPPLSTRVNVPKPKLPDPKMMAKVENVLKTREKDLSSAMKSDSAKNRTFPPLSTWLDVPQPKLPEPKMAKRENVLKTREGDVSSAMKNDSAKNPQVVKNHDLLPVISRVDTGCQVIVRTISTKVITLGKPSTVTVQSDSPKTTPSPYSAPVITQANTSKESNNQNKSQDQNAKTLMDTDDKNEEYIRPDEDLTPTTSPVPVFTTSKKNSYLENIVESCWKKLQHENSTEDEDDSEDEESSEETSGDTAEDDSTSTQGNDENEKEMPSETAVPSSSKSEMFPLKSTLKKDIATTGKDVIRETSAKEPTKTFFDKHATEATLNKDVAEATSDKNLTTAALEKSASETTVDRHVTKATSVETVTTMTSKIDVPKANLDKDVKKSTLDKVATQPSLDKGMTKPVVDKGVTDTTIARTTAKVSESTVIDKPSSLLPHTSDSGELRKLLRQSTSSQDDESVAHVVIEKVSSTDVALQLVKTLQSSSAEVVSPKASAPKQKIQSLTASENLTGQESESDLETGSLVMDLDEDQSGEENDVDVRRKNDRVSSGELIKKASVKRSRPSDGDDSEPKRSRKELTTSPLPPDVDMITDTTVSAPLPLELGAVLGCATPLPAHEPQQRSPTSESGEPGRPEWHREPGPSQSIAASPQHAPIDLRRSSQGSNAASGELAESGLKMDKYLNMAKDALQGIFNVMSNDLLEKEAVRITNNENQKTFDRLKWSFQQELAEIKHNAELTVTEMHLSWLSERKKMVTDFKNILAKEKKKAVADAKSKQWCANCGDEAQFYCCWNTSYCNYPCQQEHWPKHMGNCAQAANLDKQATDKPQNPRTKTSVANTGLIAIPMGVMNLSGKTTATQSSTSASVISSYLARPVASTNVSSTNKTPIQIIPSTNPRMMPPSPSSEAPHRHSAPSRQHAVDLCVTSTAPRPGQPPAPIINPNLLQLQANQQQPILYNIPPISSSSIQRSVTLQRPLHMPPNVPATRPINVQPIGSINFPGVQNQVPSPGVPGMAPVFQHPHNMMFLNMNNPGGAPGMIPMHGNSNLIAMPNSQTRNIIYRPNFNP